MKTLILVSLMIFGTALSAEAQKMYKEGGKFIFEAVGMPEGSYTRKLKPRTTTSDPNSPQNISSAINDEKVAYKFEISAYYSEFHPSMTGGSTNIYFTWPFALKHCSSLSGGNWRLPTKRELLLLYTLHYTPINQERAGYSGGWSATASPLGRWACNSDGQITDTSHSGRDTDIFYCIRDIETPAK